MDQQNQNNPTGSGVEFQDSGWKAIKIYNQPTKPKFITFLLKYSGGIIKNDKQAIYVLLAFCIVAIIISIILFWGTLGNNRSAPANFKPPLPPGITIPQTSK